MATSSSGIGVVGLGRTLFQPTCCYACLSSFWSLLLPCSQIGRQALSNSSPQCHASNTAYLSSLAYCMQQQRRADNASTSQIEHCWSKVAGDGLPVGPFESNLPLVAPTSELAYTATSLGDAAMLVNPLYYSDTKDTLLAYASQESGHALYGTIAAVVVVGICVVLGILQLKQLVAPRLPLMPRSISLPLSIGYVPQRSATVLITLYIALNVAFCAISYSSLPQNTWFVDTNMQSLAYIGNRVGVLCLANIALTIMFSSRNTPLLYLTRHSRADLITFHRWVGRVAILEAVIHGAIYWSNTDSSGFNMFTAAAGISYLGYSDSYWTLGVLSMIIFILIAFFSILPIRAHLYEAFLFLHIALVVLALVTLWYHLVDRYNRAYGYEVWLYISFTVWGFDRIMRVARLLIFNFKTLFRSQPAARVELLPGNEFLRITVWPSVSRRFHSGQYFFLYFYTLPLFLESHPFTIVSWSTPSNEPANAFSSVGQAEPSNIGSSIEMQPLTITSELGQASSAIHTTKKSSVTFIIRPITGATLRLHKLLLKQPAPSIISIPVLLEGPYGFESPVLSSADSILAIAGGIGITAILSCLTAYLSSYSPSEQGISRRKGLRAKRFVLVWVVRELSLVKAVSSQLPSSRALAEHNIKVIISCGQRGDPRLNWKEKVVYEVDNMKGGDRMAVVCCASGRVADEIRARVASVQGGAKKVDLVEEVFAW